VNADCVKCFQQIYEESHDQGATRRQHRGGTQVGPSPGSPGNEARKQAGYEPGISDRNVAVADFDRGIDTTACWSSSVQPLGPSTSRSVR
jgi:hypothetical protein